MNKGLSFFTILLIAGVLVGTASAEEYNINPGMWETTSTMEITGMPSEMANMMQKPPMVEKECVKDKNYNFDPGEQSKGCTLKTTRQSSKKLIWDITCDSQSGNANGNGEANFNGDTVSGWFEMNMQGPSGPMKMRHSFEGKRLGSC
jgi:hypothetical protein